MADNRRTARQFQIPTELNVSSPLFGDCSPGELSQSLICAAVSAFFAFQGSFSRSQAVSSFLDFLRLQEKAVLKGKRLLEMATLMVRLPVVRPRRQEKSVRNRKFPRGTARNLAR